MASPQFRQSPEDSVGHARPAWNRAQGERVGVRPVNMHADPPTDPDRAASVQHVTALMVHLLNLNIFLCSRRSMGVYCYSSVLRGCMLMWRFFMMLCVARLGHQPDDRWTVHTEQPVEDGPSE